MMTLMATGDCNWCLNVTQKHAVVMSSSGRMCREKKMQTTEVVKPQQQRKPTSQLFLT